MWIKNKLSKIADIYKSGDRRKKILLSVEIIAICAAVAVACFLSVSLLRVRQSRRLTETLQETVVETPVPTPTSAAKPVKAKATEQPEKKSTAPIKVDFEKLAGQNPDIFAWIYLENTELSYPVVWRRDDNEYYLEHLFDGTWNPNGTIFIDGRADKPLEEQNTVIYGHNMLDDTMFGIVDKYRKQDFFDEHPVMYLMTPDKTYCIDVCYSGIFHIEDSLFEFPVTDDTMFYTLGHMGESNYLKTGIEPDEDDRLVTLSTCWGNNEERFVVIGVLREAE